VASGFLFDVRPAGDPGRPPCVDGRRTLSDVTDFGWPEEREGLLRASSRWWAFLLLGIAAAALGLLLMFDLFTAVRTVALLVALGLIGTGAGELISAGRYRHTLGIVAGAVLILAGVLAALWPDITLWVLAVVTGIALIISGAARIMGALALRVEGWGWLFVGGLLSAVVGFLAIAWPDVTALALGLLLGLRMVLFGVAEIAFALALNDVRGSLAS
jgi:uncharacterized membrane protein HdeD (DUF308 family)